LRDQPIARSLNRVGAGKSDDCRSRHSVGLLIRSSRQTSLIRRYCRLEARAASAAVIADVGVENLDVAFMGFLGRADGAFRASLGDLRRCRSGSPRAFQSRSGTNTAAVSTVVGRWRVATVINPPDHAPHARGCISGDFSSKSAW